MTFDEALKALYQGKKVKRSAWEKPMLIRTTRSFVFEASDGDSEAYLSKDELFACDWEIMPDDI